MRRYSLAAALTFIVSLMIGTTGAQAIVIDMNPAAIGQTSVTFPTDLGSYYGVRLVPFGANTPQATMQSVGIPRVTSSGGPCADPAITADMFVPTTGLCWHGGSVMHKNETFALSWDPNPYKNYAATYEEQFLRDVADGSGTFSSPYSLTTQYNDGKPSSATDRGTQAQNASLYGGGFDDSRSYPSVACPYTTGSPGSIYTNAVCLTDSQIRSELQTMISQQGIEGKIQPGYTPLLVLLLPPSVETCLDSAGHVCSANGATAVQGTSTPAAQFCSYHSQLTALDGRVFDYEVQPWTGRIDSGGGTPAGCDEPDVPKINFPVPAETMAIDMGARLVSPLSESHIAAIVNPGLNGFFTQDGLEINDNGCVPQPKQVDVATVGSSSQNPYYLQREFNNGGAITINDPFAEACSWGVQLDPTFVVPSAVNQGDVVEFDGSKVRSTLLVPKANYSWNFGDGTTAVGPSAVHVFTKGGTYTVTLSVVDRGANTATYTQTVTVLGPDGKPVVPPGGGSGKGTPPLSARFQLLPQGFSSMLRIGLAMRVTSNQPANGIVTLSITRSAAKRAHIKTGHGATVTIGRGTVSRIKNGTVHLQLRLPRSTANKLKKLKHLTISVRLQLIAAGGKHISIVAAARY